MKPSQTERVRTSQCTVVQYVLLVEGVMRRRASTHQYFSFPNWADEVYYFWVLLCRRISFPLKSMVLKVPHLLVLWWAFFLWEWNSIFHRGDLRPLIMCTHVCWGAIGDGPIVPGASLFFFTIHCFVLFKDWTIQGLSFKFSNGIQ